MASNRPLIVYFNSACPVCDAGIKSQKDRMRDCAVKWVDVHEEPNAVTELGAGLETVRERLHVRDASGQLQIGADALATLWAETPGQRWLARLERLPLLHPLARWSYNAFARALYLWNRRRGSW